MKNFFFLAVFFLPFSAFSQYYYNDILGNRQTNREYQALKSGNIHRMVLRSFDANDQPSKGFFCEKALNMDFSASAMKSKSGATPETIIEATYSDGRITGAVTTTPYSNNSTRFQYDSAGHLIRIAITTFSDADSMSYSEERRYRYNNEGIPTKMICSKNGNHDFTLIFLVGEKGNILEEHAEGNASDRRYYYYYDDLGRLTDIVHFNAFANKLLPDYMFQYQEMDWPAQMVSVDETATDYLIWKFSYTTSGLPEIQKCYSKQKQLLGTIQYEYQ